MPGPDPHGRDHWDDEQAGRRYDERDRFEREGRGGRPYEEPHFADRGRGPRIGPTGMMSGGSTGNFGTSGSYFEDEAGRAAYGGFGGGGLRLGHWSGRREPPGVGRDLSHQADYRTQRRLPPEDRDAVGAAYADYGRAFGGYGAGGGYTPTPEEGIGRERRGWDEGSAPGSWFGRAPADSWRDAREPFFEGPHRGRGPKGYTRSGERIREDVSDRLTDDPHLDASDIEVSVEGTEVTLNGTVESRGAKRRAEDHADDVTGVTHVQNNLRVRPRPGTVAAQTDPRIAAVTEGRDADEAARDLRDERDERLGRLR